MMMQQFSPSALNELRGKMQAQLDAIGKEYGIHFSIGKMRYTVNHFSCKIDSTLVGAAVNATNAAEAVAKTEWDANCWQYGLTAEAFGKMISLPNGTQQLTYIICGLKIGRRSRYGILLRRVQDNKIFRYTPEAVRNAIANQAIRSGRI
jgi:hypothetical protein